MSRLIRDLILHQEWADDELLRAASFADERLRTLLHHIVVVQQVFHAMLTRTAYQIPPEADDLQRLYDTSHSNLREFLDTIRSPEDLERMVENPRMPEIKASVADVLMQVTLHSQNHRGQCLTRLRELTGAPAPTLDYIWWVKLGRP